MGKFYINGMVIKTIEKKKFQSGAISKVVWIEEKRDCKKPVTYTHRIEFNGNYAPEIPDDIQLLGAHVCVIGTLAGVLPSGQKIPFENLKGEKFILLSLSSFEEEPEETEIPDDLPF